jgi:hypothetical protein
MYTTITKLNDGQFRRKTGVKRNTFNVMVNLVKEVEAQRKKVSGRPLKLSYEDQVLLSLEYLREYRTYFSLGQIYGISESNTFKICRKIEDILVASKEFKLPNKKDIYEDPAIECILVDASESIVERPKKNKESTIQERKRNIPSKHKSLYKKESERF